MARSLRAALAGSLLLAAFASLATAGDRRGEDEPAWQGRERLLDVRYEGAEDLAPRLRSGLAEVALLAPVVMDGGRWDSLLVGPGWVRLQAAIGDGEALSAEPGEPRAPRRRLGPRIDALAGSDLVLGEGPVPWIATRDGAALRWTQLQLPGSGPATVELILDRQGHVTLQYLRLPRAFEEALDAGGLRAGTSSSAAGRGLEPRPAGAFSLQQPVLSLRPPLQPGGPLRPAADGPPPAGCDPAVGTWCEQADGPGDSIILIADVFDDLESDTRGWTPSGLWHESTWPVCPGGAAGGASADPGGAWYCGVDATCSYRDDIADLLLSPTSVDVVTGDTVMEFQTRIQKEEPFDVAEILFNGTSIGSIDSSALDPNAWYNFRLDSVNAGGPFFGPYLGMPLQVGFRLTSDVSNSAGLGWFLDDVRVWDEVTANPNCLLAQTGSTFVPGCDQSVATNWSFNETAFCQGCEYTFYVLVECGREMHLPLSDMEGASVAVTNLVTGMPVSLRCRNQTALADAGLGPYPVTLTADCCGDPTPEEWWGPAFDAVDTDGPGRVSWGFPDCPGVAVYDVDFPPDGLQCDELPCGGALSRMTPGESQVMDCFIEDPAGLCGLYRLDITSGGFIWDLFANCDGTNTPQFEIYQDCTEAWTAFNPLPELAISNLSTAGGCPSLDVSFELLNIGCVDHPGDVLVRLQSDCLPADSLDHVVTGPIPAGGSVPVTLPFPVSCAPVRVEVFSDPDDTILECTESLTVAACAAEEGVDSLATFDCGCTANLTADAGADLYSCAGERVQLDGSASTAVPCADPLYRWLDALGTELAPWSADPTVTVDFNDCPAGAEYTLEISCNGEPCVDADTVRVECLSPVADAGPDLTACVGGPVGFDASGSIATGCPQLEYRWLDPSGAEVRGWSIDPSYSPGDMDCALAGDWTVEVRCSTGGPCFATDVVSLSCVSVLADLVPDEILACEGVDFAVTAADIDLSSVGCSAVEYRWLDAAGTPISSWAAEPDIQLVFNACPAQALILLQARCADAGFQTCGSLDGLVATCPKPEVPVPVSTDLCAGPSAELACGAAEAGVAYWWDLDVSVDSDANGDPADDADLPGCDATGSWPAGGLYTVRAWATEPLAGCTSFADLELAVWDDPVPPEPTAVPGCPGDATPLSCGLGDPAASYSWDLDLATDSDGNGTPDDDADADGCDVSPPMPEGTTDVRVTVTDARGCTASADLAVVIAPAPIPGEVNELRLTKARGALELSWAAVADAVDYRVLRGALGTWYSHAADDAAGQGSCSTAGALFHSDPDDLDFGQANAYYLVTAVDACRGEGPTGTNTFGDDRPPRAPTASCP